MAKATAVKMEVTKVITEMVVEKVTLDLTVQEAADLHHTLGRIGGQPRGTVRPSLSNIYHAISSVGRLDVQARTLSGLSLTQKEGDTHG